MNRFWRATLRLQLDPPGSRSSRRARPAGGLAGAAPVFAALVWALEPTRLDAARRWLDHIEGQWDEALSRLKASLERET